MGKHQQLISRNNITITPRSSFNNVYSTKKYFSLNSSSNSISFWNANTFETIGKIIKGYFAFNSSHMISLPNSNLAMSSKPEGNPIVIVDTIKYIIIKIIYLRGFVSGYSSLCVLNKHSFIYVFDGNFVQVENCEYNILSCEKQSCELYG